LPANAFTRTAYHFAGWTAKRASDNKYLYVNGSDENWYPQDQQPSGYALKVFIAYSIVYDANGGYGTMVKTIAAFLDEVPLRPNTFNNVGYLMAGWTAHRASDGKNLYENILSETEGWYTEGQQPLGYDLKVFVDEATVSALSEASGDTITMRAQWEPDEHYDPIDPRDLEEPLLRYLLERSGLTLDEQDLDALAGVILGLDILSLELLRGIYEGYGETETEGLIASLLADHLTDDLFLFVYPLLGGVTAEWG